MSNPQVTSIELSTGDSIPLSIDLETGTPIEMLLSGSNLQNVTSVELDSGPEIAWVVTGVSASSDSVYVVAYAFGQPGAGFLSAAFNGFPMIRTEEASFELPLID